MLIHWFLHLKLLQLINHLRVFAQTTSDGLLIGNDPERIIGNYTCSSSKWNVESLITNSFQTLHQGLYLC